MSKNNKVTAGAVDEASRVDWRLEGKSIIREDSSGPLEVGFWENGVLSIHKGTTMYRRQIVNFCNSSDLAIRSCIATGDDLDPTDAPPMPKKNPRLGDKTPAVVEWYKKYKPSEYKLRYEVKGPGKVKKSKFVVNDEGERVAVQVEEDCIVAGRKTHLTEKSESAELQDSEYDWNADSPKE